MPVFNQLTDPAQDHASRITNENFEAVGHVGVYAMNVMTTSGLTWGYFGGRWGGFAITAGTLLLTASSTNYVVVAIATGIISVSTSSTHWTDTANYAHVYKVTTNTTAPVASTGIEDHRGGPGGVGYGGAGTGTSFTGGTLASALNEAPTVTIASSSTPAIGAAAGNSILLTGTTTVTGFDTIAAGAMRRVRFSGALVLTHNATSLILPTSANITTAANDVAEFLSLGSGNWFCSSYSRNSGAALVAVTSLMSQSAAYTLVLGDANSVISHPAADTAARTWTIPANSSVPFPIGTIVTFDNDYGAGALTIAITTDTLVLVGATGSTGSRTIASGGQATLVKVAATKWRISGTLLT